MSKLLQNGRKFREIKILYQDPTTQESSHCRFSFLPVFVNFSKPIYTPIPFSPLLKHVRNHQRFLEIYWQDLPPCT